MEKGTAVVTRKAVIKLGRNAKMEHMPALGKKTGEGEMMQLESSSNNSDNSNNNLRSNNKHKVKTGELGCIFQVTANSPIKKKSYGP